jgi:LSD1 subclass zinc finger protein
VTFEPESVTNSTVTKSTTIFLSLAIALIAPPSPSFALCRHHAIVLIAVMPRYHPLTLTPFSIALPSPTRPLPAHPASIPQTNKSCIALSTCPHPSHPKRGGIRRRHTHILGGCRPISLIPQACLAAHANPCANPPLSTRSIMTFRELLCVATQAVLGRVERGRSSKSSKQRYVAYSFMVSALAPYLWRVRSYPHHPHPALCSQSCRHHAIALIAVMPPYHTLLLYPSGVVNVVRCASCNVSSHRQGLPSAASVNIQNVRALYVSPQSVLHPSANRLIFHPQAELAPSFTPFDVLPICIEATLYISTSDLTSRTAPSPPIDMHVLTLCVLPASADIPTRLATVFSEAHEGTEGDEKEGYDIWRVVESCMAQWHCMLTRASNELFAQTRRATGAVRVSRLLFSSCKLNHVSSFFAAFTLKVLPPPSLSKSLGFRTTRLGHRQRR